MVWLVQVTNCLMHGTHPTAMRSIPTKVVFQSRHIKANWWYDSYPFKKRFGRTRWVVQPHGSSCVASDLKQSSTLHYSNEKRWGKTTSLLWGYMVYDHTQPGSLIGWTFSQPRSQKNGSRSRTNKCWICLCRFMFGPGSSTVVHPQLYHGLRLPLKF